MRASRIILLLVALIAGGLAAFLATRNDAPQQVAQTPTVIEEKKTRCSKDAPSESQGSRKASQKERVA